MSIHKIDSGQIKIVHLTSIIGKDSMGIGQVVVNLAKAENDLNANAKIWCIDREAQINWAIEMPGLDRNKVEKYRRLCSSRWGLSISMISAAYSNKEKIDIVHQHGIWTSCSIVSNVLRRHRRVPIVVSPHGSLQEWALKRSPWKKSMASFAYERDNLKNAVCLHATAEAEIRDFRDYGLSNPIALIPNGVSEKWLNIRGDGQSFRKKYSVSYDNRILLFISRITPKKGLPILLKAIERNRKEFNNWLLVIAGTDEFGHLKEVKALVKELNLYDSVLFTGPLYDKPKSDAFAAADAFVLPSYSEGSPMVVLDSLAVGVPVITTQATPWKSLIDENCGWWVEASEDGLWQAIKSMLSLSNEQLRLMGRRGQNLVKSRYLWGKQGQKLMELYSWILGQRDKPDFVINT